VSTTFQHFYTVDPIKDIQYTSGPAFRGPTCVFVEMGIRSPTRQQNSQLPRLIVSKLVPFGAGRLFSVRLDARSDEYTASDGVHTGFKNPGFVLPTWKTEVPICMIYQQRAVYGPEYGPYKYYVSVPHMHFDKTIEVEFCIQSAWLSVVTHDTAAIRYIRVKKP
jgi:hypothetical protein